MKRNVLVAAAWPYANTSLHLGHVAGLLGADILARYHRLVGNDVLFVSGSDCHGTPISIEAAKLGIQPREIAERYHREFVEDLIKGLGFSYDLYTTTLTDNHTRVVQDFFLKLYHDGLIYTKKDRLPYCQSCNRFLADRFIEGECPFCHSDNARGDQCDECGKLITPTELVGPKCKICGSTPKWRLSKHFYLKLTDFQQYLEQWTSTSEGWRLNAKGFARKLLREGLRDRSITRDTDWGVLIPLPGYEDKRIYVWFEAICGYLSASKEWATSQGRADDWTKWWQNDDALHYYVHGKDNIPFHAIIWPAILQGYGGLHLPDRIVSSEFLTLEKKQFSKSRHWAVWLKDFLTEFDPETLRFWLVVGGPETADADFSWSNFRLRVNSELIGKFGNYVNRVLSIIHKNFKEGVSYPKQLTPEQQLLITAAMQCFKQAGEYIEAGQFRLSFREIISLAENGNRFIDSVAPWANVQKDRVRAEADLAVAAQIIRCFAILVEPVLPRTSENIWGQLGEHAIKSWAYPKPRGRTKTNQPTPLYRRIEETDVERQLSRLGRESTKSKPHTGRS